MKVSREKRGSTSLHQGRNKKRKNVFNVKTCETDESGFSAFAKNYKCNRIYL